MRYTVKYQLASNSLQFRVDTGNTAVWNTECWDMKATNRNKIFFVGTQNMAKTVGKLEYFFNLWLIF